MGATIVRLVGTMVIVPGMFVAGCGSEPSGGADSAQPDTQTTGRDEAPAHSGLISLFATEAVVSRRGDGTAIRALVSWPTSRDLDPVEPGVIADAFIERDPEWGTYTGVAQADIDGVRRIELGVRLGRPRDALNLAEYIGSQGHEHASILLSIQEVDGYLDTSFGLPPSVREIEASELSP